MTNRLSFMARELARRPQPFASVVFTLSTHNPYKVPTQYQGTFPRGELPIHETVAYFDHALQKFFETAEQMPWYKNTLFVITGDHIGPPIQMLRTRSTTTGFPSFSFIRSENYRKPPALDA